MNKKHLRYCLIPVVDIAQRMINLSIHSSVNDLRLSKDNKYALFKFNINDELSKEVFMDYEWKTYSTISAFLNTDDKWKDRAGI